MRSKRSTVETPKVPHNSVSLPVTFNASLSSASILDPTTRLDTKIKIIALGSKLQDLTSSELSLLRRKQTQLATTATTTLNSLLATSGPRLQNALSSTLIFAQHEAGTAVCIDPAGWILTCAHCFGDTVEEYQSANKRRWLLHFTGLALQVECRRWDPIRDLALLKVIAIETGDGTNGEFPLFPYVELSSEAPHVKTPIICIGQPGRDDLESSTARRTKYNLVEVSEGVFRGMIQGADPQNNSVIGSLMHDAWTYWGHSGAPLLREGNGTLVGLHSSWDDETTMRHGVPLVAIQDFLREHLDSAKQSETLTGSSISNSILIE